MISLLNSCQNKDFEYGFQINDIERIKNKAEIRYSDLDEKTELCIISSYFDFLIQPETEEDIASIRQFDLIYEDFAFKYHEIFFQRMSLILVKNLKSGEVYYFSNQILLDLELFSGDNYLKVPIVNWENISEHPEINEFKEMISGVSDNDKILGLFIRSFSFGYFLNYPKCLFGEILWRESEIDNWLEEHIRLDTISYNYEENSYFFDAQGLGLLRISINDSFEAELLPKIYPNTIEKFMKGDKPPRYASDCL